jgi:hypothetical protein
LTKARGCDTFSNPTSGLISVESAAMLCRHESEQPRAMVREIRLQRRGVCLAGLLAIDRNIRFLSEHR